MGNIKSFLYQDYPEQPYISSYRDLKAWEDNPDNFPYGIVERKQMIRTKEGLLPGDIIFLWRVHFDNFTTESHIPDYFEYKYGVNTDQSRKRLIDKNYIIIGDAYESLSELNIKELKIILSAYQLSLNGKKDELINRIKKNIKLNDLSNQFSLRKYKMTSSGLDLLNNYDDIIQKHGLKKY